MGLRSTMRDFGVDMAIRINTDASAARGIACRKGLGKVRHIEVNQLWIRDRVANGDIEVTKINGKENIADIFTTHVNAEDIRVQLHKTNQTIADGRHDIAPADDS